MHSTRDVLGRYLDREGRVRTYPAKATVKRVVLEFLASKFETERHYSEREVNAVLNEHHSFGDPALLRRELYDAGFFERTDDGARYWRARG